MTRSAAGAEGSPVAAAPVVLNVAVDYLTFRNDLASHGLVRMPDDDDRCEADLPRRQTANGTPLLPDDIVVNMVDVAMFTQVYFGDYDYACDFIWDGVVNLADVAVMTQGLGAACP